MDRKSISNDEAMSRFSFLAPLLARNEPCPPHVEICAWDHSFDALSDYTLEDHTCSPGWRAASLYVVENDGRLTEVPMQLRRIVIYQARNMTNEDVPDDIDEPGESIGDALAREIQFPITHVVFVRYGRERFSLSPFHEILVANRHYAISRVLTAFGSAEGHRKATR